MVRSCAGATGRPKNGGSGGEEAGQRGGSMAGSEDNESVRRASLEEGLEGYETGGGASGRSAAQGRGPAGRQRGRRGRGHLDQCQLQNPLPILREQASE